VTSLLNVKTTSFHSLRTLHFSAATGILVWRNIYTVGYVGYSLLYFNYQPLVRFLWQIW